MREARARTRGARASRDASSRPLRARGDPAGHAGALQIGAFARHASPRHVVRPPRPTSPLRPDTDVGVAHHTLGTDARRVRREDGFFFSAFRFLFDEKKNAARARFPPFGRENSPRPLPPVRKKKPPPFLWCTPRSHDRDDPGEGHSRARERVSRRPVRRRAVGRKAGGASFPGGAPSAGGGGAASKDLPAGVAGSAQLALGARFAKLASECAIVLMHEEEDVGNKAYMIEAIRVGVVDVVRFPSSRSRCARSGSTRCGA